jgi:serine/threonine-protein kinase Chk1
LIRGILQVDPNKRMTIADIESNLWFNRKNEYLENTGTLKNSLDLAARLMGKLDMTLSLDDNRIMSDATMKTESDVE